MSEIWATNSRRDGQNITKNIFLLKKIKIPDFGALKTCFSSSIPNIMMKFATVEEHNQKKNWDGCGSFKPRKTGYTQVCTGVGCGSSATASSGRQNHDFFGFSANSRPKLFNFCRTDFFSNWNVISYGSEKLISAILVPRTTIKIPPGIHSSGGFHEHRKIGYAPPQICTCHVSRN